MDRVLATRSESHVSGAEIWKEDFEVTSDRCGTDIRPQGEFRNDIPDNDEYLDDERDKNVTDLFQGHKTRTHEFHEHEFELDTETSRLMDSGFIGI